MAAVQRSVIAAVAGTNSSLSNEELIKKVEVLHDTIKLQQEAIKSYHKFMERVKDHVESLGWKPVGGCGCYRTDVNALGLCNDLKDTIETITDFENKIKDENILVDENRWAKEWEC